MSKMFDLTGRVALVTGGNGGIGLGMATAEDPQATGSLRVASMGHVNAHMTLGALAVMQAGLSALRIPHGAGALEAATGVIAAHAWRP